MANLIVEPAKVQFKTTQNPERFNKRNVVFVEDGNVSKDGNRTDHQLLQPGTLKLTRTPYATHSPFPKERRHKSNTIQILKLIMTSNQEMTRHMKS